MSEQRTEKATPQRKKKAREAGDVVRSREMLSAAAMLAGLLVLSVTAGTYLKTWARTYAGCLRFGSTTGASVWTASDLRLLLRIVLLPSMLPALMVVLAALVAAVALGFAQGGFAPSAKALMPQFGRLNPGKRVADLFSVRALVRLAKSLLPALVVATMGWQMLRHMLVSIPVMGTERLPNSLGAAFSLGMRAAWVMFAWAALDYAVEWRAWNKRLRMSKQEMREEVKQAMGNPQIKGKIRSLQRQMARRKAKVDMRRASVVITNPTHYAVALEFSFDTMAAPTVLTKGRDLQAFDIREEARWAGVPLIENPPLARSLYRAVEPGQPIPYELYAAVAGILAWLFREANETTEREARRAAEASREHAMRNRMPPPSPSFSGGM